jgi:CHAT domain-containing protein
LSAAQGTVLILGNPATKDTSLPALPFAEREAQVIASLYGVQPVLGTHATERVVREQVSQASILHLATHASYDADIPLLSAIALAPDAVQDGRLEAQEVYGLDLSRANLVVLSACQTQLGELSAGDELVGLTRAFLFAGTPSVVSTLWTVDDAATSKLMERFHIHLQEGRSKASALRQAQIDVRAEYRHPYYWAGFVLSGDGGVVSSDRVGVSMPTATLQVDPRSRETFVPFLKAEFLGWPVWAWSTLGIGLVTMLSVGWVLWRQRKKRHPGN